MKDVKNRFGESDGKLKTIEFSNLELAGQTLGVIRGRMLGMTRGELGDYEGFASTALFDRGNMFFGDMIRDTTSGRLMVFRRSTVMCTVLRAEAVWQALSKPRRQDCTFRT